MTGVRDIAQLGAEVLRKQAALVHDIKSEHTQQLIMAMRETLTATQGVGLAAPQISESVRILIVASRPTARYPFAPLMEPTIMINPSFRALSDVKEKGWEGCLSVPGVRALVPRYTNIEVDYFDEQALPVKVRLTDFVARIFQHEYDHLEGKVYLDSLEDNADIISEVEYQKLMTLG